MVTDRQRTGLRWGASLANAQSLRSPPEPASKKFTVEQLLATQNQLLWLGPRIATKLKIQTSSALPEFYMQPLRKRTSLEDCMQNLSQERRTTRRYELHLPVHFRISQKGVVARWGSGLTRDISTSGLSFRTRKPLPVGSHIELVVEWPAKYGDQQTIDLQLTGFIVRSDSGRTAVRITSHRFRIDSQSQRYQATA